MKRTRTIRSGALVGLAGIVLGAAAFAEAADPRYERTAREMVRTSAGVQPGDVVVVSGVSTRLS